MPDVDGLNFGTATGELFLNGVTMHCAAWCCLDLLTLWPGLDRHYRWGNDIIPGTEGTAANPVILDEGRHTLEMGITGRADRLGVAPLGGDEFSQLLDNLRYLRENVIHAAAEADDVTIPAELWLPDGVVAAADVQVVGFTRGVNIKARTLRATLDIVIPGGEFPTGPDGS